MTRDEAIAALVEKWRAADPTWQGNVTDAFTQCAQELADTISALGGRPETGKEHEDLTRVDGPTVIPWQRATAAENRATRTVHGGNVGTDMVPFYLSPGESEPEYDQGHSVVVWFDDLYDLAERKDRLMNALHRVLESAVPNERDHPSMWAAWRMAERVIREVKPALSDLQKVESGRANPAVVTPIDDATGRPRATDSDALSSIGRPETGWQPIATAPKDGTEIILENANCVRVLAHYARHVEDHPPIDPEFYHWNGGMFVPFRNPVRWRPSPPLQEQP